MPITRRTLRAAALAVALAFCVVGCSGLEFAQDRRLSFMTPASNQLTRLPVRLAWSMKDYPSGRFAVFIDQQPIKVGHNIDSVLPDATHATHALLAESNVYITSADHLTVKNIPDLDGDTASRQRHTATVVLINAAGDRINESAWSRSFDLGRSNT